MLLISGIEYFVPNNDCSVYLKGMIKGGFKFNFDNTKVIKKEL